MEDALAPTNPFAIRLPVFEGPLDLLLYLIRQNEIDIYDIPIEKVTRQYIHTLESMEILDLEVAGEFFVMASTLMYIKSRMLLPPKDAALDVDSNDETTDPRWELVQQLLEYKRFKETAGQIEELIQKNEALITRVGSADTGKTEKRPLKPINEKDLWSTFNQVLQRLSERIVTGEIHAEAVTVADRMEFILQRITKKQAFRFTELFDSTTTLTNVVATFLPMLELTRLGELQIKQDHAFAEIHCTYSKSEIVG